MKHKIFLGYSLAVVGFILILINAVGYIFNLEFKSSVLVILGIVFLALGTNIIKKNSKKRK